MALHIKHGNGMVAARHEYHVRSDGERDYFLSYGWVPYEDMAFVEERTGKVVPYLQGRPDLGQVFLLRPKYLTAIKKTPELLAQVERNRC